MSDNNEKKTIALYAVILFTSAFIVLLLTAYSQIKFSKNAVEYESLLSSEKKAKINFKTNLNSALEENRKVLSELNSLKEKYNKALKDNDQLKQTVEEVKKEEQKESEHKKVDILLLQAQQEYINGNILECATILLNSIDKTKTSGLQLQIYDSLVNRSYKQASRIAYDKGIKSYKSKDFPDAVSKFTQSIAFSSQEYYSDDCYYYLAYSQYRMGNSEAVKKVISDLFMLFPDTTYKKDAEVLLAKLD